MMKTFVPLTLICLVFLLSAGVSASKRGLSGGKNGKGDHRRHQQQPRTIDLSRNWRGRYPYAPKPSTIQRGPDILTTPDGTTYRRRPLPATPEPTNKPVLQTSPPVDTSPSDYPSHVPSEQPSESKSPTVSPLPPNGCRSDGDCAGLADNCTNVFCTIQRKCKTCPVKCETGSLCSIDSCDPSIGCVFRPIVTCPTGESCDPLDGSCKSNNDLRPCISVIDESSQSDAFINRTWAAFRSEYPNRPFCLLQPQNPPNSNARLWRPDSFTADPRTVFAIVNRDGGNATRASDWGTICGIDTLAASGLDYVGLFIDQSGSMYLSTVRASYNQFLLELQGANLTFRTVANGNEDWVTPFRTVLN